VAKANIELADLLKARLLEHANSMVDEWAEDALESDDPKHKKEFIEMALKANGAYSKEDAGAHLPVFNITIGSNGAMQATQTVQMVEEVPAEALPAPETGPSQEEIEKSLAIFDLNLSPIE
jgi:hypothetical protein